MAAARLTEAKAAIAGTQRQMAQVKEEFDRDRLLELTEAEEKVGQLTEELKKATQRQSLQRLSASPIRHVGGPAALLVRQMWPLSGKSVKADKNRDKTAINPRSTLIRNIRRG